MTVTEEIPDGYTKEQWESYQADPISHCVKELENSNNDIRYNAVDILRALGTEAIEAIPALIHTLQNDSHPGVRAHTAFTIFDICHRVDASDDFDLPSLLVELKKALIVETDEDTICETEYAIEHLSKLLVD